MKKIINILKLCLALIGIGLFLLFFVIFAPFILHKIFTPNPDWIPELEKIYPKDKINFISSSWDKVFLKDNPNFEYYIMFNSLEDRLTFFQFLTKNAIEHEININGDTLHTSPENLEEYKYFDDAGGKYYLDHGHVIIRHHSIPNIQYRLRILCSPNKKYMYIYGIKEFK